MAALLIGMIVFGAVAYVGFLWVHERDREEKSLWEEETFEGHLPGDEDGC